MKLQGFEKTMNIISPNQESDILEDPKILEA
jgi:hypothetical protein